MMRRGARGRVCVCVCVWAGGRGGKGGRCCCPGWRAGGRAGGRAGRRAGASRYDVEGSTSRYAVEGRKEGGAAGLALLDD